MATTGAELEHVTGTRTTERPRILHFQQYNAALQHAVLEADRIDASGILERAAAEVVYQHLVETPGWESRGAAERLRQASGLYRDSGLGLLDLSGIGPTGGEATVSDSHFARGWVHRYGKPAKPVCTVSAGYLRGTLTAVFERSFRVSEEDCSARGAARCRLVAVPEDAPVDLLDAEVHAAPSLASAPEPLFSTVDEQVVVSALFTDPVGADITGRIEAFGATLTRLWGDFYSKVSFRFEQEVPRVMGNKFSNLASIVLTEAGHVCAFHSFGGILASEEWHSRVAPSLRDGEDWVHALVAVINSLGWGTWRVHALVPGERLSVRVYDGYEALGYRRFCGRSETPRCYLARGAAGALMNLLYVGDFTARPELTPSLYNQLFRSPLSYRAVETRCRAMDDPFCELVVNPLSPSLNSRFNPFK
jgi:predicted hydrocarbon binding protein